MSLAPKDHLTEEEVERGLKIVLADGITSQLLQTLTGGVFLVAFALKLGASNVVIGLLAAIPPLGQLFQLPSVLLIERVRQRRLLCVIAASFGRFAWFWIAALPFFFSSQAALFGLVVTLILNSALGALTGCAWNSWMRDLIPQKTLGRFFSKRLALATGIAIVITPFAGIFIDGWRKSHPSTELYGYSLLFLIGAIAGMVGVFLISRIPEPRMQEASAQQPLSSLLRMPFSDPNFRNLLFFLGSWNFAINLAAPFFTVYMLKRMQLDLWLVLLLAVASQIASLGAFRLWGTLADRRSNKSVLAVCGPLYLLCVLGWLFTMQPQKHAFTLPLLLFLHLAMGIATAGTSVAAGNIGLKLAPQGQATAYLAANSLVNAVAASLAPILGGVVIDFFTGHQLHIDLRWSSPLEQRVFHAFQLSPWDFFFVLSFLFGLYAIHRLSLVQETGDVTEKVVLSEAILEVRRYARKLSTIGGLWHLFQFPMNLLRQTRKKKKDEPLP